MFRDVKSTGKLSDGGGGTVGGTAGCIRRPHEYEAGIKGCITICHTCKCDGKTDTHELVDISGFNSKNDTFYLALI